MLRFALLMLVAVVTTCSIGTSADAPFPPINPVFRLQSNTYEALQLQKQLQSTWGESADIPDSIGMFLELYGDNGPEHDQQVVIQLNFTQSKKGFVQEIIYPATSPVLEELSGDENTKWITVGDYAGVIQAAISGTDDEQLDSEVAFAAYGEHLRKTAQGVNDDPLSGVLRYEFYPTQLRNTYAHSKLRSLVALAATLAQRRDNEEPDAHAVRSAGIRFLTDAGQMCLQHLDTMAVGLRRGDDEQSVEATIEFETTRKSPLADVFKQVGQVRNRSFSYLHPAHAGLASVALPLPEALADPVVLSELIGSTPFVEVDSFPILEAVIQGLCNSCCQVGRFEVLAQTVPCNDKTSALATVFPLRDGQVGALSQSSIQQVAITSSDFHFDGGAAWCLTPDLMNDDGHQYSLHIAESENCIAFLIGTDAAHPVYRDILQRDFNEPPAARRYANSAIAIDLPLDSEWPSRLLDLDDLWVQIKSNQEPKTRLTTFVDVHADKLEVVTRFEDDAALFGALYMELLLESALEDAFEWLFE